MFYTYHQNNSGGVFIYDSVSAPYVIIEAGNALGADVIAEGLGLYFDGCADGRDCDCCGDRWYRAYDNGSDEPEVYGKSPHEASRVCVDKGEVLVRVFYADGLIKEYYGAEDEWIPQLEGPEE